MQAAGQKMNAESLLMRLEGVRQRSSGQWSAKCPAHEDKSPSLSIKETPDGRILLHCYGACQVRDVLGALGLDMEDLFPTKSDRSPLSPRRMLTAGQALELLHDESLLVATAAGNVSNGIRLTPADRKRLFTAAGRIAYLRSQLTT